MQARKQSNREPMEVKKRERESESEGVCVCGGPDRALFCVCLFTLVFLLCVLPHRVLNVVSPSFLTKDKGKPWGQYGTGSG